MPYVERELFITAQTKLEIILIGNDLIESLLVLIVVLEFMNVKWLI